MEKLTFVGKNITPKDKEELEVAFKEREHFSVLRPGTEREATEKEKELLQTAFGLVSDEMKRLGVPTEAWSTPEIAHFSNDTHHAGLRGQYVEDLRKIAIFKPRKLESLISSTFGIISDILEKKKQNIDIIQLHLLMHEDMHAESAQKYFAHTEVKDLQPYRLGYSVVNPKTHISYFDGLNEAVVEKTTIDLVKHFSPNSVLQKLLVGLHKKITRYEEQMNIMESIIGRIAEKENKQKRRSMGFV